MAPPTTESSQPPQPQVPAPDAGGLVEPALPRRVSMPPEPTDKLWMWLMLLICVLGPLPPLAVELGEPDTRRTMEKQTLLSSIETRNAMRAEDSANAWLVPLGNNGRYRVHKPPLAIWLTMAAWSDVSPPAANATAAERAAFTDTLVLRARLLGLLLAVLGLGATYWAGYSIGGVRTAAMATLATATMLLFMRQARTASYDTHLFAWVTLAIAAGLWAIRPLKPTNWTGRRVVGWLFCGLALAAGIMTKGPIALMWVGVPLVLTIVVAPRRRLGNAMGLVFALLLGGLLAAPWFIYVMEQFPDATQRWGSEYAAERMEHQPFYYYLMLLVLCFPWSVYLVASLFQPFLRARGEHRRRTLLAWLWFVVPLVIMSIPAAKQYRYIMPLLPAAGILIGQLWSYHAALAKDGLRDPGVNALRLPHWIMLGIGSIALPVFIAYQQPIADWINATFADPGEVIVRADELPGIRWYVSAALGLVLAVTVAVGVITHWRWEPSRAFAASVVWIVIAATVVQFSYANSYHGVYEQRADAERLAAIAGGRPVYYLYNDTAPPAGDAVPAAPRDQLYPPGISRDEIEPDEEFLIYFGRHIPPTDIARARNRAREGEDFYLLARVIESTTRAIHLADLIAARTTGSGLFERVEPTVFHDGRTADTDALQPFYLYRSTLPEP